MTGVARAWGPFNVAQDRGAAIGSRPLPPLPRFSFDAEYVRRLTAGDPGIEAHFTKYFGDLLSLKLRGRLRSAAQVEDAKQETFLRVISTLRRKGLDSPESLGSFVNSVCNNVLFELYRAQAKVTPLDEDQPEPLDSAASVETTLAGAEERDLVRRIISSLPEKDREILTWLFLEERDKDEVCRELHVDRNYLRVLLHRAKIRFRAEFASMSPTL
jgi:RNA polymerase sigma-70 factor (ECF subfamily)